MEIIYIDAFFELSTCRDYSNGVGPIPWLAIVEFARYHEMSIRMTEHFVAVMREMDAVYLKHQQHEFERKAAFNKAQSHNRKSRQAR